jgi:predicted phosphoribosyltransferase
VAVARKLGAPFSPELTISAVTTDGVRFLNTGMLDELGASEAYLERETAAQAAEARRREERFRGARPAARIRRRTFTGD